MACIGNTLLRNKKLGRKTRKEKEYLEDLRADVSISLKLAKIEKRGRMWTGLIWLRIETNDGLL